MRWALRATHYRQPTNFSPDTLEAARQSVQRVRDFRTRLKETVQAAGTTADEACQACETAFSESLDDDLNISGALASVFDLIRTVNKMMDNADLSLEGAQQVLALMDRLDAVVGLLGDAPAGEVPEAILDLVNDRQQARRDKDFGRSDAIRDQLLEEGWIIEDTPDGARVKPA